MDLKEFKFTLWMMGWQDRYSHGQFTPPPEMPQEPLAPPGFVELLSTDQPLLHIRTHSPISGKEWKPFDSYSRAINYLIRFSTFQQVNEHDYNLKRTAALK